MHQKDHRANHRPPGLPAAAGSTYTSGWEKWSDNYQGDLDAGAMFQLSPHHRQQWPQVRTSEFTSVRSKERGVSTRQTLSAHI